MTDTLQPGSKQEQAYGLLQEGLRPAEVALRMGATPAQFRSILTQLRRKGLVRGVAPVQLKKSLVVAEREAKLQQQTLDRRALIAQLQAEGKTVEEIATQLRQRDLFQYDYGWDEVIEAAKRHREPAFQRPTRRTPKKKGHACRPLRLNGRVYVSANAAADALGMDAAWVYSQVKRGRAAWISDAEYEEGRS